MNTEVMQKPPVRAQHTFEEAVGLHSMLITPRELILRSQISIYSEAGGSGTSLSTEACPMEISRLIRILTDDMLIKDSRCGNNHFELKLGEKHLQERAFGSVFLCLC